MDNKTRYVLVLVALTCAAGQRTALAAGTAAGSNAATGGTATGKVGATPEASTTPDPQAEFKTKLKALNWVTGPTIVTVGTNSQLKIPDGYVFLDAANTAKFDELEQNLGDRNEVMVSPADLRWNAYLEFEDGGYVKDDEKIDAAALLKSLKENTEAANAERRKRGWVPLHLLGWASPPAYNRDTKRLEWATTLAGGSGTGVNFFTKILGRRGHTSVVMVADSDKLAEAEEALDKVLDGYGFNSGETYAEWKPGDKVAEYGLAALVLGGAAAIATKKGLWAVLAGFMAAAWKAVAAGVVAAIAWLRGRFKQKT